MFEWNACRNVYSEFVVEAQENGSISNLSVVSGSLPPGMALSWALLLGYPYIYIKGSCNFSGVYSFTVRYRQSTWYTFSAQITISDAGASIDLKSIPPIKINTPYYHVLNLVTTQDPSNFTVSLTGTLPSGITFTPTVGSPTFIGETAEFGTFNISFTVTNNLSGCTTTQDFVFIVSSLYFGVVLPCTKPGLPYSFSLNAKGGVYPYRYHIRTGYALPSDLMLDTYTGSLHGSVYEEGIYVIGVRVFDGRNDFVDQDLTLICSKECLPTTFDWLPSAQSKPVVVGESYMEKNLQKFLPAIFEV